MCLRKGPALYPLCTGLALYVASFDLTLERGLEPNRTELETTVYKFEKNPNRTEPNNDGSLILKILFFFSILRIPNYFDNNELNWSEMNAYWANSKGSLSYVILL